MKLEDMRAMLERGEEPPELPEPEDPGFIPGTAIPKPTVELSSADGNAACVLLRVRKAIRRAGCDFATLDAFTVEAKSGDYGHLLLTAMAYVDVE